MAAPFHGLLIHLKRASWTLVVAFVVGCVLWFLTHPIPPTFGKP